MKVGLKAEAALMSTGKSIMENSSPARRGPDAPTAPPADRAEPTKTVQWESYPAFGALFLSTPVRLSPKPRSSAVEGSGTALT